TDLDQFRIKKNWRCSACTNEVDQTIAAVANERVVGRSFPIFGLGVIRDDPTTARVEALGNQAQPGSKIVCVKRTVPKNGMKFADKSSPIKFCQQPWNSPKRTAENPGR